MPGVDEYVSYFRGIATQNKEIGHTDKETHFYRMNVEEVLQGLRTDIHSPALILEAFEGKLVDGKSDNNLADRMGAFMIIKQVEVDNFDEEHKVLDDCERIGLNIIKRMRRDSRTNPIQDRLLQGLDLNRVNWQKVGPVFDNYFGYRFIFSIIEHENMRYDDTLWLDGNG